MMFRNPFVLTAWIIMLCCVAVIGCSALINAR